MIATLQRIVEQRENEITQQLRYLLKKRYELIPTPNVTTQTDATYGNCQINQSSW